MSVKTFMRTIRRDLKIKRSGFLGMGRKVTVSNGDLSYSLNRKDLSEETAQLINSKMPATVMRPPMP